MSPCWKKVLIYLKNKIKNVLTPNRLNDRVHCNHLMWICIFICVCVFTGGVCVSLPLLASLLRMLLSDICRRAVIGGTRESVAGSRVTSAFMSLRSSSSWLRTTKMSIITTCQVAETKRSWQDLLLKLKSIEV